MRNRIIWLLTALIAALGAYSQQMPQFNSNDYEGWVYNNPYIELNSSNIGKGRVTLYVNQQGLVLTLVSPVFSCQGADSIAATVLWYTKGYSDPDYVLSRAALTMALDDATGQPLDSVTVVPTAMSSTHTLELSLPVPAGASDARLRFVAWEADVVSSGGIKRAVITATTTTPHDEPQPGDVDGNGTVNISDAISLINYVLSNDSGGIDMTAADMDDNGTVNISDVIMIINHILGAE